MEKVKSNNGMFLIAAKQCLKVTLEKSKGFQSQIDKAGPKVGKLGKLDVPVSSYARKSTLSLVGGLVFRASGPLVAIVKVCDMVLELERLLIMEEPSGDIVGYLSLIKQQEEVLGFVSDNCGLTVQWMEDIVKLLDGNNMVGDIADEYLVNVKKTLRILKELKVMATHAMLDEGILSHALNKLEVEFRRLCQSPECSVIPKLRMIVEILKSKNRLENCQTIYVGVRGSAARKALKALDLSYLEIQISESDYVESLADHIVSWGTHMEVALKQVLRTEYELCRSVFHKSGLDVEKDCFAQVTAKSGFLALLNFVDGVTRARKDAIKLLKLLDIFSILDKLRIDFNMLFGGKPCLEIQNLTRNLIKRVVDGASEIFFELSLQVEFQGSKITCPTLDGRVPRFMTFVTNYCIMLLEDDYRSILSQVISIHQMWNQNTSHDRLLREEFQKIVKAVEINLQIWSKTSRDTVLSYFFLMNNYRYLHRYLQGTAFGNLMGDNWLSGYVQRMESYAAAYIRESWGKLSAILSEEGLMFFCPDKRTNENLVKEMLREFNNMFEDMYKIQSNWILLDNGLREKAHQLIVQAVVPAYKSYLRNYDSLMGKGSSRGKHVKYSAACLETMLRSLFQPKMSKSAAVKHGAKSFHLTVSGGASRQHHQAEEPKKVSHSAAIRTGKCMWIPCR